MDSLQSGATRVHRDRGAHDAARTQPRQTTISRRAAPSLALHLVNRFRTATRKRYANENEYACVMPCTDKARVMRPVRHRCAGIDPYIARAMFNIAQPTDEYRPEDGVMCCVAYRQPKRAKSSHSVLRADQAALRVVNQMPNAIGTMPSKSSHDTGSRSTSQPNNKPSGGIRKCSALADVALARVRIMNHR